MPTIAAAGAGFLVAVLWFDLMFDVQFRGHPAGPLPAPVLASIGSYYRRVTTEARPMNRLIMLVMLATVATLIAEVVLARASVSRWLAGASLALAVSAIGLARARIVRNAARIGAAVDPPEEASRLARLVYGDHVFCAAAMIAVVGLQIAAALLGR
jgi:hypothetical protein